MHISDGILSGPLIAITSACAITGVGIGLSKMDYERVPRVGMLSATFFVASLIQVPAPGSVTSAHLLLNGLLGFLLGWHVFPALLTALFLQAILFGFGGLTVLGSNVCILGFSGLACHYLFRRMTYSGMSNRRAFTVGFGAGMLGVFLSALIAGTVLLMSDSGYISAAGILLLTHLPVMFIEGFVTGSIIAFIIKVRPDYFNHERLSTFSGELSSEQH